MSNSELISVTIEFNWEEVGKITLNGMSDIHVPTAFPEPAVYKIQSKVGTYVGETSSLKRRLGNYRAPGGSKRTLKPRTNRRIQFLIIEALATTEVLVWKATNLKYKKNGKEIVLANLHNKHERLLIENAIINEMNLPVESNWNYPKKSTRKIG